MQLFPLDMFPCTNFPHLPTDNQLCSGSINLSHRRISDAHLNISNHHQRSLPLKSFIITFMYPHLFFFFPCSTFRVQAQSFCLARLLKFKNQFPPVNNSCPAPVFDVTTRTTVSKFLKPGKNLASPIAFHFKCVHTFAGYLGLFVLLSLHFARRLIWWRFKVGQKSLFNMFLMGKKNAFHKDNSDILLCSSVYLPEYRGF